MKGRIQNILGAVVCTLKRTISGVTTFGAVTGSHGAVLGVEHPYWVERENRIYIISR